VLSYAAVTPARDEARNLPRLATSLAGQTVLPAAWVIVENGSSDGTAEIAQALAAEHAWITVLHSEAGDRYDRTSPYMRAFHAGVAALAGTGDLVVKLDADVSMDGDYFERLSAAFEQDPALGIASGTLLEERDGQWREWVLLNDHCWGPTRTYRRACLEVVLPLDDGIGYSVIDEAKAHLAGFSTRTLTSLPFRHHRPEGAGEGSMWRNWHSQGAAAHYLGYRFSYLVARCTYRLRHDRAALALPIGYVGAALRRRPRYGDTAVVSAVREQQRARHFVRAVLGRARRPAAA
jgi:poly-beta-1,6-N-acetyl-D-glucosamine synthase